MRDNVWLKELAFFGVVITAALAVVAISALVPLWALVIVGTITIVGVWLLLNHLFPSA